MFDQMAVFGKSKLKKLAVNTGAKDNMKEGFPGHTRVLSALDLAKMLEIGGVESI